MFALLTTVPGLIARSKAAQIALAIGGFLFAAFLFGEHKKRQGKLAERAKAEREAREVLEKIERTTNERVQKTREARASAPRITDAASVPDSVAARIFRDPRSGPRQPKGSV